MPPVEVGFIGAGNRAQVHYESLEAMEDVSISAVCELDEERLRAATDKYGVEHAFTDYEEMLDEVDLDAVYAIMFPELYDSILPDVLERGQNVFIEKPPGIHSDQTRRWAELAEENGCKTAVGFQRRFHPLVVEARRRVRERSEVVYGVASFHKANLGRELHNDLVYDVIHVIDLLAWMGGGVKSSRGFYKQVLAESESFDLLDANVYTGILELESGGVGILDSNRAAGGRFLGFQMHGKDISVYGDIHGDAAVDSCVIQTDGESFESVERIDTPDLLDEDHPPTAEDGTYQINEHFIDCVREDREPGPTLAETIDSIETVEEILGGTRLPTHLDTSAG